MDRARDAGTIGSRPVRGAHGYRPFSPTIPMEKTKLLLAASVAAVHGPNNLTKQTALSEKGEVVKGRGDTPNKHDILTGSQADGTAFSGSDEQTCGNWTKSGDGAAQLGHHDRQGLRDDEPSRS